MITKTRDNPWKDHVTEPKIDIKVRRELRERSNGVCERCYNNLATKATPILRRWEITEPLVVQDIVHLCGDCLSYCENTHAGRIFMVQFRQIKRGRFNEPH